MSHKIKDAKVLLPNSGLEYLKPRCGFVGDRARTALGNEYAALFVDGNHTDGPVLPPDVLLLGNRGTGAFNAKVFARFAEDGVHVGNATVEEILAAAPPFYDADTMRKCPKCEGKGEHVCPCCQKWVNCKRCEATGDVPDLEAWHLKQFELGGIRYDARQFAQLLRFVSGACEVWQRPDAVAAPLMLVGVGWRFACAMNSADAECVPLPVYAAEVVAARG